MAHKLKRSLFIGLGGTGATSLLHTKKRFIETYGEVPPMIDFLVIDTDSATQNNFVLNNHNKKTELSPNQFVYAKVKDAKKPLERFKDDLFNWVPSENWDLTQKMTHGAGQVRSSGRFALHFNHSDIYRAVHQKIAHILDPAIIDNNKFQPNGNDVEINFVFSVGGGTGSGTFIDIAYLVNDVIQGHDNSFTKIGFVVLPDVFRMMQHGPSMDKVRPNAFGALVDLDYLMHLGSNETPLEIRYQGKSIDVKYPPFDLVFTINNRNQNGHVYKDISELAEQIGLAMFIGSSELSSEVDSSYDNVLTYLGGGGMMVENKKPWACGFGVSEIIYDGNHLGNIYARKASAIIINDLLTAESSIAYSLADIFIDTNKIRENNDNDFVIDSILNSSPNITFDYIENTKAPKNEIDQYLNEQSQYGSQTAKQKQEERFIEIDSALEGFIIEKINQDSGVGNVDEFLGGFLEQIKIFKQEMTDENEELKNLISRTKSQISSGISELKESASNFTSFLNKTRITNAKEDLIELVNMQASNHFESIRRQEAIVFFNKMLEGINKHQANIKDIISKLKSVGDQSRRIAVGLQNNVDDRPKPFIIELHKKHLNTIGDSINDYNINDFVNSLTSGRKLYDFHSMESDLILESFWKYTKKLNGSMELRNRSIEEVFRSMKDEELSRIVNQAIEKSSPLWSNDFQGHVIAPELHSDFVIGVPNTSNSILSKDAVFEKILGSSEKVSYNSTNMHDRVMVYRLGAATPIYAVNDLRGYEIEYKNSRISHHIDANWKLRMERENFSIHPSRKEDGALQAWVLGFIYNLIKFDDAKYKIYSEDKGDALDGYWFDLSPYRDEAFKFFKRESFTEEVYEAVRKKAENNGKVNNNKLIKKVTEDNNYMSEISRMNLSNEDLRKREFAPIAKLFREEIDFVKKELLRE
jgi:hypothetical protein